MPSVTFNFVRDFIWAFLSYCVYFTNIGHSREEFGSGINDPLTQSFLANDTAQWLYSTIALVILFTFYCLYLQNFSAEKVETLQYFNLISIILGASIGIPAWNSASYHGRMYAMRTYGMKSESAEYFSSIFTGLVEGLIQESSVTIFGLFVAIYLGSETFANLTSNPGPAAIYFAKRYINHFNIPYFITKIAFFLIILLLNV